MGPAGPSQVRWNRVRRSLRLLSLVGILLVSGMRCHAQNSVSFLGAQSDTIASDFVESPHGVAVDQLGNIYVADTVLDSVFKVSPAGVKTDIVTGTSATDVAVDSAGNVYIADPDNNQVLEFTALGVQTTVGAGLKNPIGVAVDATGDVFIADTGNFRVVEVPPGCAIAACQTTVFTGTAATPPFKVAISSTGDLFIAESNGTVQEVTAGGQQNTVGTGLSTVEAVAVDGSGNVFLADVGSNTVIRVTAAGVQTTVSSGLQSPYGLAIDGAGNLFIADENNQRILEVQFNSVDFGGVEVCPANQNGQCTETLTLNYAVPAGVVATPTVTNEGAPNLDFTLGTGSACGGPAGTSCTVNVTFTPRAPGLRTGAATVAVGAGCPATSCTTTPIQGTGQAPQVAFLPGSAFPIEPANVQEITGVAVDESGNMYYVDNNQSAVGKIVNGTPTTLPFAGLSAPAQVAVDGAGSVYVVGGYIAPGAAGSILAVSKLDVNNNQTTLALTQFEQVNALTVDGQGRVYVAGLDANSGGLVFRFDLDGSTHPIGNGLKGPQGLAIGADGTVYIADSSAQGSDVFAVSPAGNQTTIGSGFLTPTAVKVDAGGTVYVLDNADDSLVALDTAGVKTSYPLPTDAHDMAIDGSGRLYFAMHTTPQNGQGEILEYNRTTYTLDFPNVAVGSVSAPVGETVSNIGNQPLTISGLGYTSDAGGFSESPQSGSTPAECATALAPGASCLITSIFAPPAGAGNVGFYEGSFTLTDNALNATTDAPATQKVSLEGSGVAASGPPVAMSLTGPVASAMGGPLNTFTVTETDANDNPTAGDGNAVNFAITGPQEYNFLSTTLVNGQGTLVQELDEPGQYSIVATDLTNGLTATDNFTIPSPGGPGLNYASIALQLSAPTPYYSDNPILGVTVTGANVPPPTGTISYSVDNGTTLRTALNTTGQTGSGPTTAFVALGRLAVGQHSVSVTYSGGGDNNFYLQSGPQVLNFTVQDAPLTFLGSERPANFAQVGDPNGIAADAAGNIYVADSADGEVLKYDSSGTRTVFLNGLSFPNGLAFDNNGNLFISDLAPAGNGEVLEYSAANGSFPRSFQGLGSPGKVAVDPNQNGSVYVADPDNSRVVALSFDSIQSVVPANGLLTPKGVAVDTAHNVYIADTGNGRVVKLDPAGNQTTIYVTDNPVAVSVDTAGNVYVVDAQHFRVVRIDNQGHQVLMNSAGVEAVDVAMDPLGNLFLPDGGANNVVTEVATAPGIKLPDAQVRASIAPSALANYLVPSTVLPVAAATDLAGDTEFEATTASGNCPNTFGFGTCSYIAQYDPKFPGVRSGSFTLSNNGTALTTTSVYGIGLGPLAIPADPDPDGDRVLVLNGLASPGPLAVDSAGTVYVADAESATIYKVSTTGTPVAFFAGTGAVGGLAVDGAGNVFATYSDSGQVEKISPQGVGQNFANGVTTPGVLAIDGPGNLYVAAGGGVNAPGQVIKITPAAAQIVVVTDLENIPVGVAVDGQGDVFAAATAGTITEIAPNGVSTSNTISFTAGPIAIDAAGEIYAVDTDSDQNQIIRIGPGDSESPLVQASGSILSFAPDNAGDVFFVGFFGGNTTVGAYERTPSFEAFGFPNAAVGSTSGTALFPVTNIGNQQLLFLGTTVPDQFQLETVPQDGCTTTPLAPAATCSFGFGFAPTVAGPALGTATVTNNSLNDETSVLTVSLQGTGVAAGATTLTVTGPLTGVGGTTSGTYTVTELGAAGATVPGDSDVVLIKSSLPGPIPGPTSGATLTNGVGTFTIQYPTVTTGPVAFTIAALDATNNLSQNIVVQLSPPPIVDSLTFSTPPLANIVSGGTGGVVVTAQSADNTGAVYIGPITLVVTGPNGYSQTYGPIPGGGSYDTSANALTLPGTYTYTASGGGLLATATQTVVPASFNVAQNGQPVATPTAAQAVTLVFNTATTLGPAASAIQVVTQGVAGLDFAAAGTQASGACIPGTAYAAGQTCTVAVVFTPKAPGLRLGAVVLEGPVGQVPNAVVASALLSGIGNGALVDFAGTPVASVAPSGTLTAPEGVTVDLAGNVFIADSPNQAIVELPVGGGAAITLNIGGLAFPIATAIDGAGNLYIADRGADGASKIVELPFSGAQRTLYSAANSTFSGIAVDSSGDVYISDQSRNTVTEISTGGAITTPVTNDFGLDTPQGLAFDAAGNLYIADAGSKRILQLPADSLGDLITVAGNFANAPNAVAVDAAGTMYVSEPQGNEVLAIAEINGQGVPQTTFTQGLGAPLGVALDGLGNLYVASPNTFSVLKFPRSTPPALTFAAQVAGSASAPQAVSVENAGNLPLTFSAITAGANTALDPATTTCGTAANVTAGAACNLGVEFNPPAGTPFTNPLNGAVTLADNAIASPQTVTLTGTIQPGVAIVHSTIATGSSIVYGPQTVTATVVGVAQVTPVPTGSVAYVLDGAATAVPIPGNLVNGSIAFQLPQLPVGNHTIGFAYSGDGYYAGTPNGVVPASLYVPFTVTPATLTVTANTVAAVFGQPLPALTSTISGFVFADTAALSTTGAPLLTTTATAASAPGSYPVTVAKGTLAAANYTFAFVPGTLTISQASQTITLAAIANQTYGAAPVAATATSTSALPVTIAVQSGPATIANGLVTITGAGTVTLRATQAGNADYAAATAAATSFTVNPATLTVTAGSFTEVFGQPLPTLTSTVVGFVNADTAASAVTGTPQLTTTATATSAPGSYPITVAKGTLAAANYTFAFVPGTLTIAQATQTITLATIVPQIYGAAPFAVPATATSGLPVTIAVQSGPATVANGSVTITGAGTVTLRATQAGNADYSTATAATTSFIVNPATLTVTASSFTEAFGQPLPTLTSTVTGFVNADSAASSVTGTPLLTTTATAASAPGSYPVTVAKGTLAAANYIFTFVPGTLTISQASQTITLAAIANATYGAAPVAATATATSGLPVTVAVQSGPATVANGLVTITGAGTVTVVATQAGNADYAAAQPVTGSFTVAPASTSLAVNVSSNVVRTPNPISLTATLTSPVSGATGTVTFLDGATTLGQSALSAADTAALSGVTLAIGSHNITATYSGTVNFAASTSAASKLVVEPLATVLTTIAPTVAVAGASDTTLTVTGANFSATAIVAFNGTALATTFVSSTQLTAVIPAALLATAGNATVTVTDAVAVATSQAQAFTILPVTSVVFTGPPTSNPGDQPTLNFALQQAYATPLSGTMILTFTPDAGNPDNPQVQFATGGRTFNFTLSPNSTVTPQVLVQAGTISGTISVSLQLTTGGVNVTPPTLAPIAIVVPKVAPTISALSFTASGNTLTVSVTGYSSTREIQSADFTFTPASGATLAQKTITVPGTTLFANWYIGPDSAQFGSGFTYTQVFTLSGDATAVAGIGVTLTNTIGTSTEVTAP